MALLQNQEFLVWQLRTSYLHNIKDGIGERLINVDNSVFNDPNFRAAGWATAGQEIQRTYSPPIPTAISSDYFNVPSRTGGAAQAEDEDEGGMITGRGSADTVGPSTIAKRRRRREQLEEDDSSDLSDDSEDEIETARRAAQQIKFAKMPVRNRSGSSPIRGSQARDGVEVNVISPSTRSQEGRLRSGSLTGVEAIKQRARRDTATSSDLSSDNDMDPALFRRRQINPSKAARTGDLLAQKHEEDERQLRIRDLSTTIQEGSEGGSARTDLSSEFGESADSESLLDDIAAGSLGDMPPPLNFGRSNSPSPKKAKPSGLSVLQALPPGRPISIMPPISLLGQALNARKSKPRNPVETFARFSGKGVPDPLHIHIFVPFSSSARKVIDMPLLRSVQDNETGDKPQVTVADAIGLSLYRYGEDNIKPPINESKLNVNLWTLRMVEDGEVDYDFPPLVRTRPITDFTSNNNRGGRGRSREKPYDDFALVEATPAQYEENKRLTPKYETFVPSSQAARPETGRATPTPIAPVLETKDAASAANQRRQLADRPNVPAAAAQYNRRRGPMKQIRVHFTSVEALSQTTVLEINIDTYLAEVLDTVCKRWKLDKAYHILKVSGTNTSAPTDRTVEALGDRSDLDLVRRRFANDGAIGIAGSPGSSSPNAPLMLAAPESPRKGGFGAGAMGASHKRGAAAHMHPLAQANTMTDQLLFPTTSSSSAGRTKRYVVTRKQPMSFAPSQQRILLIDDDFLHILPPDADKSSVFDAGGPASTSKTTRRIPFQMIVGCKVSRRHPKSIRVFVAREGGGQEQKRYDFEAVNASEAEEIVEEITRGIEAYGSTGVSVTGGGNNLGAA